MSAAPLTPVVPVVFVVPDKSDIPKNPEDRFCVICQETMDNTEENLTEKNLIVGHISGTVLHLFHRDCAAGTLSQKTVCPICVAPVANAKEFANAEVVRASAEQARAHGAVNPLPEGMGVDIPPAERAMMVAAFRLYEIERDLIRAAQGQNEQDAVQAGAAAVDNAQRAHVAAAQARHDDGAAAVDNAQRAHVAAAQARHDDGAAAEANRYVGVNNRILTAMDGDQVLNQVYNGISLKWKYKIGLIISTAIAILGIGCGIAAACLFLSGSLVTGGILSAVSILLLLGALKLSLKAYSVFRHGQSMASRGARILIAFQNTDRLRAEAAAAREEVVRQAYFQEEYAQRYLQNAGAGYVS